MKQIFDQFDPRQRESRGSHGRVVEGIGQAIVAGQPPPGDLLPRDEELAEQFGVSRTVLREAMKTLAAKGMVSPKARVGTRIRPRHEWNMFDAQVLRWHLDGEPSDSFYEQLFEMRLAFEPHAAALAARSASAADIARIQGCVSAMRAADSEADFSLADLEFHKAIFDAAGNAFFFSVVSLVSAALLSLLRRSSPEPKPNQQTKICNDHQRIADAIAARDESAAKAAMQIVIEVGWARVFGQDADSAAPLRATHLNRPRTGPV
ncbi:FadR/GntR family transcriptional regulator [Loktanella sp. SALINAS62]|uniref:FadR/GntR family transcriptional regulator n=1 Tax=Loktanella sp. SALINAS62 TaxID=2706124 RepID=UPI001B8D6C9C|nr:FadR/GntR family transcriptional regulator [Loktanella sp. SALINAS62]MBS1301738.1 FadR family transcriptional regulator [Loktanella sp. SALINAS62]